MDVFLHGPKILQGPGSHGRVAAREVEADQRDIPGEKIDPMQQSVFYSVDG